MEELRNCIKANEEWEAFLYDWHNGIKLRRQNKDIEFWDSYLEKLRPNEVLVRHYLSRYINIIALKFLFNTIQWKRIDIFTI